MVKVVAAVLVSVFEMVQEHDDDPVHVAVMPAPCSPACAAAH
jgi:hypothetical protein